MQRALVTGAAGFLGFHLARALSLRPDTEVVCVDNFSRGADDTYYRELLAATNVTGLQADLSDLREVERLPADVDVVFHLAALNGTQNFYERPLEVIKSCTGSTLNLVERYARRSGLRRFVFAGTSEAYASTVTSFGWEVPTGEDVPLSITDVFNPRWSYAGSKILGEIAVAQAGRTYGMPFSIIRYHNAYGPRMGDKHVIPDFLMRARQGTFVLNGHADTRSFMYVDDSIAATLAIGETPACAGEIINVGSEDEISILDLAKKMMEVCGFNGEIHLNPSPAGSVRRRAPKIEKLRRLTGFVPRTSLEDGLRRTARFYLDDDLIF